MPPDINQTVGDGESVNPISEPVNPIYEDILKKITGVYTTGFPGIVNISMGSGYFSIDEKIGATLDNLTPSVRKIVSGSNKEKTIINRFLSIDKNRAMFFPPADAKFEKELERIAIDEVNGINFTYDVKKKKLLIVDKNKVEYETDEDGIALFKSKVNEAKKISVDLKSSITVNPFNFGDRILLTGPTGSGKTFQFHDVGNFLKEKGEVDYVEKLTVTEGFEDLDFLCYIVMKDGTVSYIERELITKLRECANGKKMVLCIDEINRGSRNFMNFILTLLDGVDGRHYVLNNYIKDEKILIPMHNILLFATMNKGSKYTGTSVMDEALNDRFSHVKFVTYNPEIENELITQGFGDKATKVREIIDATRKLHKSGELASAISTRGIKMWGNAFLNSLGSSEDLVATFTDTLLYRIVNMDEFGIPNQDDVTSVLKEFHSRGFIKD